MGVGQSYPNIARLIALSDYFKVSIDKLVNDYEENCSLYIEKNKVDYINEEVIEFLCAAKIYTYAGKVLRLNLQDLIHMIYSMYKEI